MRHLNAMFLAIAAVALVACASSMPPMASPVERQALAPRGVLRVGVYPGSPVSLMRDPKSGEAKGISVGIGTALAARLGVPFEMVEFAKLPRRCRGDARRSRRSHRHQRHCGAGPRSWTSADRWPRSIRDTWSWRIRHSGPRPTWTAMASRSWQCKEALRRAPCRSCCNTRRSCLPRPSRMPKTSWPGGRLMPSPRRNRFSSKSPTTCLPLVSWQDATARSRSPPAFLKDELMACSSCRRSLKRPRLMDR